MEHKMPLESQLSPVQIPKDANVLAVCLMGINRSPKLVEILQEHGYQNVAKLGIWQPMMPRNKREIVDGADYIVALDPRAARELKDRYGLRPKQVLIELDILEYEGEEDAKNRRLREPEEIYDNIRQQIAPYLSD